MKGSGRFEIVYMRRLRYGLKSAARHPTMPAHRGCLASLGIPIQAANATPEGRDAIRLARTADTFRG
ncbi:hypothetical protein OE88DRAFT_1651489 [Heliocybe sulcata]|uniref:Uncharacterized protein n=1 Tax=Heliocybe sulcata TaxID=5364 RepID=A0A5C3NV85_9AGAM|nr:hypothetical protein OE88DRAFT_1651489 [Heliocybe sulcata]